MDDPFDPTQSPAPRVPTPGEPAQTGAQYRAQMEMVQLASADADGSFTDDQLCKVYRLSKARLNELRENPAYRALFEEQLATFQAECASRHFQLQMLGTQAIKNAKEYLVHHEDKLRWDATKFILSKILPNPEQRVALSGVATPSITVEASVVLNDRLLQLRGTLPTAQGEEVVDLEGDPNLHRPAQ